MTERSTAALRALMTRSGLTTIPCCYDALSARLAERTHFPVIMMDGFAVSVARIGMGDASLLSYGELIDQGRDIVDAVTIPVIGDGRCGFGNPLNVKRTVSGFAAAGFAGVVIGDGVTPGSEGLVTQSGVVDRDDALIRIRAACDARDEGADIVVIARTSSSAVEGGEEVLWRTQAFAQLGADAVFVDAPLSEDDVRRLCALVPVPKMVGMAPQDASALPPLATLERLGVSFVADPTTTLSVAANAMEHALAAIKDRRPVIGAMAADHLALVARHTDPAVLDKRYGEVPTPQVHTLPPSQSGAEIDAISHNPRDDQSRRVVPHLERWIVGALIGVIGLYALYMASQSDDTATYWIGIGLFILSVIFNFFQIKHAFDRRH